MGVYDRQIALATRLIAAKGQLCTWREPGTPTGPANAPVEGVPADFPVSIVFLSNSKQEGLAGLLSMFAGTEVPTGGMRGLMAAVPFEPSLMGRVQRGVTSFNEADPSLAIMDDKGIDQLNVNGEIILYYLRFAR